MFSLKTEIKYALKITRNKFLHETIASFDVVHTHLWSILIARIYLKFFLPITMLVFEYANTIHKLLLLVFILKREHMSFVCGI